MAIRPYRSRGTRPRKATPLLALGPSRLERGWSFQFSNQPMNEFGYYGSGFLEAARTLARSFATRRARRQIDIVPVLFLYRHSIELLAKAVILSGNELVRVHGSGESEDEILTRFRRSRHRLLLLLDSIAEIFERAGWQWHWRKAAIATFEDTRRVIEELDALDPDSFSFRYATTLRGERAISSDYLIDPGIVFKVLDDLAEALDTAVFGLDAEGAYAGAHPQ